MSTALNISVQHLYKLVKHQHNSRRGRKSYVVTPNLRKEAIKLFLEGLTKKEVWEQLQKKGYWISYRHTCRILDSVPLSVRKMYAPRAKEFYDIEPGVALRNPRDVPPLGCVIFDWHILDCTIKDGKRRYRPWVLIGLDVSTRMVVVAELVDHPSSAYFALGLKRLITGVYKFSSISGLPDTVYLDNDKIFWAKLFSGGRWRHRKILFSISSDIDGFFSLAGIKPIYALAYNPRAKGMLERFFRTLENEVKNWKGYTGNSIQTRPDKWQEEYDSWDLLTLEEARSKLYTFLVKYHTQPHRGLGMDSMSPIARVEYWRNKGWHPRELSDPSLLRKLLLVKKLKVHSTGVVLFGTPYFAPELALHLGKFVMVRYDPFDLSKVWIEDTNGELICEASTNVLKWNDTKQLKEYLARQRKVRKMLKDWISFLSQPQPQPQIDELQQDKEQDIKLWRADLE